MEKDVLACDVLSVSLRINSSTPSNPDPFPVHVTPFLLVDIVSFSFLLSFSLSLCGCLSFPLYTYVKSNSLLSAKKFLD